MIKIEEIDFKILDVLKDNSHFSTHKVSKKTGIPVTTVYHHIKKLEEQKIIKNYTLNLDYKKIGKSLLVYILVFYDISTLGPKISREELGRKLINIEGVEHVAYTTGSYDIILTVRLKDIKELDEIILDKLRKIPGIGRSESYIVLEEVK